MTRTAIPVTATSGSAFVAEPSYTSVTTVADGASVTPGANQLNDVLLFLKYSCSGSSASVASIAAGDNPPAWGAGLGDIVIAASGSAANAVSVISLCDSYRTTQDTGLVHVEFDSDVVTDASAYALSMPK